MATSTSLQKPVLPFAQTQAEKPLSESIASDHSLLEIDRELDILFDSMQDELKRLVKQARRALNAFTCSATPMARRSIGSGGSFA